MFTVLVHIQVKPEFLPEFIDITRYNAQNSRQETGVVRFDFFQEIDKPESFKLVEVYRTQDDLKAHQTTSHYQKWREVVAPMMAADRTRQFLVNLDPQDSEWS